MNPNLRHVLPNIVMKMILMKYLPLRALPLIMVLVFILASRSSSASQHPYTVTKSETTSSTFVWRQGGGPEGGQILGFGISANYPSSLTSFAAVDGSVYQTQIGNSPWAPVNIENLPSDLRFNTFTMSPNFDQDHTLIVAGYHINTSSQDLYVSTDGGQTWVSKISTGCHVVRASPRFNSNSIMLAGCSGQIFRSTNGGGTWDNVSGLSGLGSNPFLDIDFSPAYSIDNTVFAVSSGYGIYRSTN